MKKKIFVKAPWLSQSGYGELNAGSWLTEVRSLPNCQ